jgi:methionyl-tRNA formyltransferase
VLQQRALPIAPDDDAGSLHDKLAALGAEMIVDTLADLGRVRAVRQPQEGVTYAHKIDKRETVLDWSRSAVELERAVRAFRPAPGASTSLAGETIKIWRSRALNQNMSPGELTQHNHELLAGCGEGALAIEELQRAGGKRMSATEFLRGRPLVPGARLG